MKIFSARITLMIDVSTFSSEQVNKLRLDILNLLDRKRKEGSAKIEGTTLIIEYPLSEDKNVTEIIKKVDPDLAHTFSFWDILKMLFKAEKGISIGISKGENQ